MEDGDKILFISYHFPPDSLVGAIRPAKFVKYLSRRGWRPYVLTIRENYIPQKEYTKLKEVSHVPIIRTEVWPTLPGLALGLRDRLLRLVGLKGNDKGGQPERCPDTAKNPEREGVIQLLKRYLISVFELPDSAIGWFLPAVWKGFWLIRRERIRLIVTSSPPRSVALIGLFLSRITEAKLVSDLRDPWFLHGERPANQRSWLSDKIETWLELKILKGSEKVVVTTEHYRDFLVHAYSHLPPSRFHTIWNGYDAEDFRELDSVQPNKKLTFSYLGTFYIGRNPNGFLKALSEFMADQHVADSEIEVNFVGDVRYCGPELLEEMIKSNSLSACVTIKEPLPYRQALSMMRKSHVLLLYTERQYWGIPAKTFEYLASGRRILCFSEGGATPDLITKAGAGIVVKQNDVKGIRSAIQTLYLEYKAGKLEDRLFDVSMFERDTLTGQFSTLLRESLFKNG